MKKINDGGPAFPQILGERYEPMSTEGMSLRDYFAAKAMQGLVSAHTQEGIWTGCGDMEMNKNMAATAYEIADAMLAAREVGK